MNKDFWDGKKVLISGHTGFKGSWLTLMLRNLGAQVIGYALAPSTEPSLFKLARLEHDTIDLRGDVCDLDGIQQAVKQYQPEIVFHMAAQALVRKSYREPVATFATNVMGTVNVLEAIRGCDSVRTAVVVTSDKCYDNKEWQWGYRENEALGGFDPYSSSKACAELVTSAYRNAFFQSGIGIASARAGNVIGGGDWAEDRLIPDLIRACESGETVKIRSPGAIRPWQHVLEPLSAYLLLAEKLHMSPNAYAQAWNFGPSDKDVKSVAWILQKMALFLPSLKYEADLSETPHEASVLKLDSSKARSQLGWMPRLPLELALEWTADWYRAVGEKQDARQQCLAQIAAYSTLSLDQP